MCNDDWNIGHRKWSKKMLSLGGPTLKKNKKTIQLNYFWCFYSARLMVKQVWTPGVNYRKKFTHYAWLVCFTPIFFCKFTLLCATCVCALHLTYCISTQFWVHSMLNAVGPTFMKSTPTSLHLLIKILSGNSRGGGGVLVHPQDYIEVGLTFTKS
jgi:hypothetical protein